MGYVGLGLGLELGARARARAEGKGGAQARVGWGAADLPLLAAPLHLLHPARDGEAQLPPEDELGELRVQRFLRRGGRVGDPLGPRTQVARLVAKGVQQLDAPRGTHLEQQPLLVELRDLARGEAKVRGEARGEVRVRG